MYVTLEPCSHVGKTPPCADAVIAAGITRVVSAIEHHARSRRAGPCAVAGCWYTGGCRTLCGRGGSPSCRAFPAGPGNKRPHIILKLAVSSDGKIAAAGGVPVAITGEAARARAHPLRAQCSAILVGIGTVLADDPLLTCRLPGMEMRSPPRVVLDHALRIPESSRLVQSARETPLWIMTSDFAETSRAMKLGAAGVHVMRVPGRGWNARARSRGDPPRPLGKRGQPADGRRRSACCGIVCRGGVG